MSFMCMLFILEKDTCMTELSIGETGLELRETLQEKKKKRGT